MDNSVERDKRIDKQALLGRINYYETQYSGSASHFDHGIVYICRILIDSIESGRFDADDTELSRLQVERDKAIEGLKYSHRFAKRDDLYDAPFVDEILKGIAHETT